MKLLMSVVIFHDGLTVKEQYVCYCGSMNVTCCSKHFFKGPTPSNLYLMQHTSLNFWIEN